MISVIENKSIPDFVFHLGKEASRVLITSESTWAFLNGDTLPFIIEGLVSRAATSFSTFLRLYTVRVKSNVTTGAHTLIRAYLVYLSTITWNFYSRKQ